MIYTINFHRNIILKISLWSLIKIEWFVILVRNGILNTIVQPQFSHADIPILFTKWMDID